MILIVVVRSMLYLEFVRVWLGVIIIDFLVCIFRGFIFFML